VPLQVVAVGIDHVPVVLVDRARALVRSKIVHRYRFGGGRRITDVEFLPVVDRLLRVVQRELAVLARIRTVAIRALSLVLLALLLALFRGDVRHAAAAGQFASPAGPERVHAALAVAARLGCRGVSVRERCASGSGKHAKLFRPGRSGQRRRHESDGHNQTEHGHDRRIVVRIQYPGRFWPD